MATLDVCSFHLYQQPFRYGDVGRLFVSCLSSSGTAFKEAFFEKAKRVRSFRSSVEFAVSRCGGAQKPPLFSKLLCVYVTPSANYLLTEIL
jgi:hypothetical protein